MPAITKGRVTPGTGRIFFSENLQAVTFEGLPANNQNLVEGVSEGSGLPIYLGTNGTTTLYFASLIAGTGIVLDATTSPGSIIINIAPGYVSSTGTTTVTSFGFGLEDGSGDILLEDASGYIELESGP